VLCVCVCCTVNGDSHSVDSAMCVCVLYSEWRQSFSGQCYVCVYVVQ